MTPINVGVYVAAYSGAIAGMTTSGWITDDHPSDYALATAIAGAYAQEFDAVWNNATPINSLEQESITAIVSENFRGRAPGPLADPTFVNPANWTANVSACIAIILEGNTYFASQGIVPPSPGGGSGNSNVIRLPVELVSLSSVTPIATNDVVSQVTLDVDTAYSPGATLKVTCNGQTLFDVGDSNPQAIGLYTLPLDVVIGVGAVVDVVVAGGPTVGSSAVSIFYYLPNN